MPDRDPPLRPAPESRAMPKRQTRFSLVWFIPILAAVVGAWVAVTRILSEGPKITITLKSAERLEAGKTKIHYNGVHIGTVTIIELSKDHRLEPPRMIRLSASLRTAGYRQSIQTTNEFARIKL
jgi:paraquat-inducible protein B